MTEIMPHRTSQGKPVHAVDASGRLLRIEEIADRLSVSRSMAWKLTATGQLRAIRIGRALRVHPRDLEAFIERAAHAD
jgi:excisionase family DNA binding protein